MIQQQQNATAAAVAAADYYEQQFKMQQQKNHDMEQQYRSHLDQFKELKVSLTSTNERKSQQLATSKRPLHSPPTQLIAFVRRNRLSVFNATFAWEQNFGVA